MITSVLWFGVGMLFLISAGARTNVEPFLSRDWWVDVLAGGTIAGIGFLILTHLAIKVTP